MLSGQNAHKVDVVQDRRLLSIGEATLVVLAGHLILLWAAALGLELDDTAPQKQYEKALELRYTEWHDECVLFTVRRLSARTWCADSTLLCRSRNDATAKQLRQAADLLKSAAGVNFGTAVPLELASTNTTEAEGEAGHDNIMTRHYPGLEIAENGHVEALKELAACYELGTISQTSVDRSGRRAFFELQSSMRLQEQIVCQVLRALPVF